ncbi:MAG TPA: DUF1353 domain-containing protein [Acidimicrobiales bacterium]
MGFAPGTTVDVRENGRCAGQWEVLRPITYHGARQTFVVPGGSCTDFASVPRVLVWLIPRYGRWTPAAILHDHLWRVEVPAGTITRPEADGIFRRAMRELGVPFLKRWLMWAAVRIAAFTKPGGRERWLRDSWQVLPLLAVGLPVAVPPALVILVCQAAFYVAEHVVYVPLAVARRLRPPGEAKQVNRPRFDLTTD